MEYYLWRNGKAITAEVFDTVEQAQAFLAHQRSFEPNERWYMEDEDSREVTA